ncbi:hypothetical protein [Pseudomonas sp.]|uniref:hypothetical protein n=1 Tax=Pseudomonas sp. TaxID=306 RepID=UPI003FD6FEC2
MTIQWSCNKQPNFYLVEGRTDDDPPVLLSKTISVREWEAAPDKQVLFEETIAVLERGLSNAPDSAVEPEPPVVVPAAAT